MPCHAPIRIERLLFSQQPNKPESFPLWSASSSILQRHHLQSISPDSSEERLLPWLVLGEERYRTSLTQQDGETSIKVLEVLEDAEVIIVDLEVNLGEETHTSPTLCVRYNGNIIPLSTPDARPILMNSENAIKIS